MIRYRGTRAVIHLDHLAYNVKQLQKLLSHSQQFFCPMVKANGYGHGDAQVSQKLSEVGVKYLGVGLIEEGLWLKEAGNKSQILFFGASDEQGANAVLKSQMIPVISHWDVLKYYEAHAPRSYPVQIKFDTGMHRLGFSLDQVDKLVKYFSDNSKLRLHGVMTHLHTGEDLIETQSSSLDQLLMFQTIRNKFSHFNCYFHSLNSAGFLNFCKMQKSAHVENKIVKGISVDQGVRPGLAIYGLSPVSNPGVELKFAMSLRSEIVKYQFVKKGEGVSYNHTWKASQDSIVGIVPIGYADGYHRTLSNRAPVLFRGKRVPLVGNVCMDYLMIDVTSALNGENIESLNSEPVTLFGYDELGNSISAAELAKLGQTITWEILTSVGVRVPKESEAGPEKIRDREVLA